MAWIYWTAGIIFAYVLVFHVLSHFILPFARKEALPSRIPKDLQEAITQMEKESKTPYEFIHHAREYVLSMNYCSRIKTITHLNLAFETDLRQLLARRGFMHCTQLNHLMRIILVKSKFFSDEDVRIRSTFLNFNFHQYLQVHLLGQWFDVDIGGDWMGVRLGSHAWGFR